MTTPQDPSGDPTHEQPGYGPPPAWDQAGQQGQYGQPQYGQPQYGQPHNGQQPAGPAGWGPASYGPQQTETKAVIALVLAITSFVLFPVVPAIAALVLAASSKRDIQASGGRLSGLGLVTASKIIAWANIALAVGGILLFVLAFGLFVV